MQEEMINPKGSESAITNMQQTGEVELLHQTGALGVMQTSTKPIYTYSINDNMGTTSKSASGIKTTMALNAPITSTGVFMSSMSGQIPTEFKICRDMDKLKLETQ